MAKTLKIEKSYCYILLYDSYCAYWFTVDSLHLEILTSKTSTNFRYHSWISLEKQCYKITATYVFITNVGAILRVQMGNFPNKRTIFPLFLYSFKPSYHHLYLAKWYCFMCMLNCSTISNMAINFEVLTLSYGIFTVLLKMAVVDH